MNTISKHLSLKTRNRLFAIVALTPAMLVVWSLIWQHSSL